MGAPQIQPEREEKKEETDSTRHLQGRNQQPRRIPILDEGPAQALVERQEQIP